jgi:hypothetical protein
MSSIFRNLIFIILVILLGTSSCRIDIIPTDPNESIRFSSDTIRFDTVFTQSTSITKLIKVFNTGSQDIRFESIRLTGGNISAFRLNVQGQATNNANNIVLPAKDSIYIYATVTAQPNDSLQPFLQMDRIELKAGTLVRYVELEAYGQNAIYLNNPNIQSDTTWSSSKPIVIRGGLMISPGATLTINAGCRLFMHYNAPIVVKGSLQIRGSVDLPVRIRGDRLDEPYRNFPGTWPGIQIYSGSTNNRFQHLILEQAEIAVSVAPQLIDTLQPSLQMDRCIIHHARTAGLDFQSNHAVLNNCLISQCGIGINITGGGRYRFTHNTVVGYSSSYLIHDNPVLFASDTRFENGLLQTGSLDFKATNCIFWGEGGLVNQETVFEKNAALFYQVLLSHCLIKSPTNPSLAVTENLILNQNPLFDSVDVEKPFLDFRTSKQPDAPGIDQGVITPLNTDLDGRPRNRGNAPDLGCYEKP